MKPIGVVVMAHGTPHTLEDLPAFYTEIRRGSPPPAELLADLERRYRAIGGTSPLNERTAAQVDGIRRALEGRAPGRFRVAGGAKFRKENVCRGQRGMAAQIDFSRRSKPAQFIVCAARHEKGGFGEIILRRNVLHGGIVQPIR